MFRCKMLAVGLTLMMLAGCRTASSSRYSSASVRPVVAQTAPAAPCPTPYAAGQVPPPPPPGLGR